MPFTLVHLSGKGVGLWQHTWTRKTTALAEKWGLNPSLAAASCTQAQPTSDQEGEPDGSSWHVAVIQAARAESIAALDTEMEGNKSTSHLYQEQIQYEKGALYLPPYLQLPKSYARVLMMKARAGTLVLNSQLYKWKLRATDLCPFCAHHTKTLQHLLVDCTGNHLVELQDAFCRHVQDMLQRQLLQLKVPSDAIDSLCSLFQLRPSLSVLLGGRTEGLHRCLSELSQSVRMAALRIVAKASGELLEKVWVLRNAKQPPPSHMGSSPRSNPPGAQGRMPMVPRQLT